MSLHTDKIFFRALNSDTNGIRKVTGGRIYNTSIPVPDQQLDNEPLPYIIITFDGLTNEGLTKDSSFEGDEDKVQIGISVVAEDRDSLGALIQAVRDRIDTYFVTLQPDAADYDLIPDDYVLSASHVGYDPYKPSFFQSLTYNCDTKP